MKKIPNKHLNILDGSIAEAKFYLRQINDPKNDFSHGQRTAANAVKIGEVLGYTDLKFLEACGWWHDVGRLIDPPNHEAIGAHMLRACLHRLGASSKLCEIAYQAIVYHGKDMKPETVEGDIVRDADKLEYISIPRWEACLKGGRTDRLVATASMLPELPHLLALAPSRELYRQNADSFRNYLIQIRPGDAQLRRHISEFLARQPAAAVI